MLSISARGTAKDAEEYYQHLSEKDDYYQTGAEKKGVWMGSGASVGFQHLDPAISRN